MAQSGKVPPLPLVPIRRLLLVVGTATAFTKCLLLERSGCTTLSSLRVLNFESDAATSVGASEMLECKGKIWDSERALCLTSCYTPANVTHLPRQKSTSECTMQNMTGCSRTSWYFYTYCISCTTYWDVLNLFLANCKVGEYG